MSRHRNEFPVEGGLPAFAGATAWLNSGPVTAGDLQGRVVLVSFGTYTCINWIRSLPYVRAWADKYASQGLAVIGVQTPEFEFEKDLEGVGVAIRDLDVRYPVAVDNDYAIWRAFDNHYWPALYFADEEGHIRHHRFGEGEYEESERVLQMLLARAGAGDVDHALVRLEPQGVELGADWADLGSPENYVGYERTDGFASSGGPVLDERHEYTAPSSLRRNQWALSGEWRMGPVAVVLEEPGGAISCRFHARDLHLVLRPSGAQQSVRFRVRIDGMPPGPAHGLDVDEQGNGTVTGQRLYQLVRQPGPVVDRLFGIEFLDAGAEAFVFTFG
jgi:Thioredoxin like C-terminal domain/AhpC/TSA family